MDHCTIGLYQRKSYSVRKSNRGKRIQYPLSWTREPLPEGGWWREEGVVLCIIFCCCFRLGVEIREWRQGEVEITKWKRLLLFLLYVHPSPLTSWGWGLRVVFCLVQSLTWGGRERMKMPLKHHINMLTNVQICMISKSVPACRV